MLEDEEELGQLVERVVAVPELGAVAVLREDAVAEAVDRGDGQLREVARVADLARGGRQAVAHLERSLLGEGAEHDLPGLRLLQQQEVQRPEDDAVRLARAGPGDDEKRAIEVADDRSLRFVEVRVMLSNWGATWAESAASLALRAVGAGGGVDLPTAASWFELVTCHWSVGIGETPQAWPLARSPSAA